MTQPNLGKKIADLRKAKGLTQEELVEKCNLNVRTLQRIESGEVTPRSYTIKTIFTALDYNVYDSSEITPNKFRNAAFIISNWLEQFYRYFIDLFNLKTNTMKKVTILLIIFSSIVLGLFAILPQSNAQKKNSTVFQVTEKPSTKDEIKAYIKDGNFSCSYCFYDNDEIIGSDVKFNQKGVTVNAHLIRLNIKTGKFNIGSMQGTIMNGKVEVWTKTRVNTYSDKKMEKINDKFVLKGNAKLTISENETIEADEIVLSPQK